MPACHFCACACLLSHHTTSAVARSCVLLTALRSGAHGAALWCPVWIMSSLSLSNVDSILPCSPSTYCPLIWLFAYTGLVPKTHGMLQQVVSQMVHLQGILPLRHHTVYVRVCTPLSCVCVCVLYVCVGACSAERLSRYLASPKAAPAGPARRGRVLTGVSNCACSPGVRHFRQYHMQASRGTGRGSVWSQSTSVSCPIGLD